MAEKGPQVDMMLDWILGRKRCPGARV